MGSRLKRRALERTDTTDEHLAWRLSSPFRRFPSSRVDCQKKNQAPGKKKTWRWAPCTQTKMATKVGAIKGAQSKGAKAPVRMFTIRGGGQNEERENRGEGETALNAEISDQKCSLKASGISGWVSNHQHETRVRQGPERNYKERVKIVGGGAWPNPTP